MEKIQIKIDDVKQICAAKRNLSNLMNLHGLDNIEFLDTENKPIKIDQQYLDDFKFTGLDLVDFIDSGFYQVGFEENE